MSAIVCCNQIGCVRGYSLGEMGEYFTEHGRLNCAKECEFHHETHVFGWGYAPRLERYRRANLYTFRKYDMLGQLVSEEIRG